VTWPSKAASLHQAGEPLGTSDLVVVLVHGRHQDAQFMLDLADRLPPLPVSYLALEEPTGQWYPFSFLEPTARNEPQLTSALATVSSLLAWLDDRGYGPRSVVFMGFSQGACLLAEYVLRHPDRYGGAVLLIGGAIGPPGTSWDGPATLAGTPIYLGTSDPDDWVPATRVRETAAVLAARGAHVTTQVFPGLGHEVSDLELDAAGRLIAEAQQTLSQFS
jgi:phospholipase/carboxylesterase